MLTRPSCSRKINIWKSRFRLLFQDSLSYCYRPNAVNYPFKPVKDKTYTPYTKDGVDCLALNQPLCVSLPSHTLANGDKVYTEHRVNSVTTVLKNSLPYNDYMRLVSWKKKTTSLLAQVEYQKARRNANNQDFVETEAFDIANKQAKTDDLEQHDKLNTAHLESLESEIEGIENQSTTLTSEQLHALEHLGRKELVKYRELILNRGNSLHKLIHDYLDKKKLQDYFKTTNYWQSVSSILDEITDVRALESCVHHTELRYAGTVDAIARFRGDLCVLDWKTSKKPKISFQDCFDYPYQAVAYAGAVNHDNNYPFQVNAAAVIIVYNDGRPADVLHFPIEDCQLLWQYWLTRLEMHNINNELKRSTNGYINYFSNSYSQRKLLMGKNVNFQTIQLLQYTPSREESSERMNMLLKNINLLQVTLTDLQRQLKERFPIAKKTSKLT